MWIFHFSCDIFLHLFMRSTDFSTSSILDRYTDDLCSSILSITTPINTFTFFRKWKKFLHNLVECSRYVKLILLFDRVLQYCSIPKLNSILCLYFSLRLISIVLYINEWIVVFPFQYKNSNMESIKTFLKTFLTRLVFLFCFQLHCIIFFFHINKINFIKYNFLLIQWKE